MPLEITQPTATIFSECCSCGRSKSVAAVYRDTTTGFQVSFCWRCSELLSFHRKEEIFRELAARADAGDPKPGEQ